MNSAAAKASEKWVLKPFKTGDTDEKCFDKMILLETRRGNKKYTITKIVVRELGVSAHFWKFLMNSYN